MEAEVLNPRRTAADVNGNSSISGAELEVLKLQELVRKLEKQNEQLRSRANAVNNCPVGPRFQTPPPLCLLRAAAADEPFAYFQPSSEPADAAEDGGATAGAAETLWDELEVLDLQKLPVGEPDSWLYVSPKAKMQSESALSPLQWCRQVLDHPGPEVELAKMTFCHRLDQARRSRGLSSIRPYSCIEGLSSLSFPNLPYTKPAALTETPAPLLSSGQSFLQPTVLSRSSCSLSDRAPTFLSSSTPHNTGRRHAAITPQSSLDSEAGVSELEDESISMSYKLQDMTDVEVMARLQEESLRQDFASTSSTAPSSRRRSSFSLQSLRRHDLDLEEEDEEDESYDQLPPPQPRLFRTGSMQRVSLPHSHTFSSIRDCRRISATPHYSHSGLSQFSGPSSLITEAHTAYRSSTDKLRRSMPNLMRAPSMPSVPSIPCVASPSTPPSHGPSSLPAMPSMRSSQSFDSSSGFARLQSSIPPPGPLSQRVQSVGNFPTAPRHPLKATAYVSPTVQQGPAPTCLSSSSSFNCISSATATSHPLKPGSSLLPQPMKGSFIQSSAPRSSLPRPASFIAGAPPRASKISQPTRSLLTPPKSLAALSALRDGSWKDGCY
ncbi:SLAIN motif-containing protein 1 isoform X1 [Oryzias latipes]|uniref:SLAIN motif family, member 1a n=1 Tax=Oryzias latipes TaxID=8090 RepID=H2M7I2_ORYLA|nr:SLAIN motif-containing protein 1 isoform X1 [Oryzias latipes]